jgi:hypothetical protein
MGKPTPESAVILGPQHYLWDSGSIFGTKKFSKIFKKTLDII